MEEHKELMIWLSSAWAADNSGYVVQLDIGDDRAQVFEPDMARSYAIAVLTAVNRAMYDQLVMKQMTERFHLDLAASAALVVELRKYHVPLDDADTKPFSLTPGLTMEKIPFIEVSLDGVPVGSWRLEAARSHAMGVLELVEVVNLDNSYFKILTKSIQLEANQAHQMVTDLSIIREELRK